MAGALRSLEREVVFLTDGSSAPLLTAGMKVDAGGTQVFLLGQSQEDFDAAIHALAASLTPTPIVAINRPVRGADGHRYSMRLDLFDDLLLSVDHFFAPPGKHGCATLAVGDGGNELRFGGLR
jgi:hypothetical protein